MYAHECKHLTEPREAAKIGEERRLVRRLREPTMPILIIDFERKLNVIATDNK